MRCRVHLTFSDSNRGYFLRFKFEFFNHLPQDRQTFNLARQQFNQLAQLLARSETFEVEAGKHHYDDSLGQIALDLRIPFRTLAGLQNAVTKLKEDLESGIDQVFTEKKFQFINLSIKEALISHLNFEMVQEPLIGLEGSLSEPIKIVPIVAKVGAEESYHFWGADPDTGELVRFYAEKTFDFSKLLTMRHTLDRALVMFSEHVPIDMTESVLKT